MLQYIIPSMFLSHLSTNISVLGYFPKYFCYVFLPDVVFLYLCFKTALAVTSDVKDR